MTNLSYAQLEGIWLQAAAGTQYATQSWAALMAAIAEAESGGNPNATNPTDNNGTQTSWGLWQISLGNHSEPSPNWNNPLVNAQLALGKLENQGLGAWGTYTSGAYEAYISGSTTPTTSGIVLTSASTAQAAEISASQSTASDCMWHIDPFSSGGILADLTGHPSFCVFSKSEARALIGGIVLAAGMFVMTVGFGVLAVATGIAVLDRAANAVLGGSGTVAKVGRAAAAAGLAAA